ncbi:MAG: LCP family protein [Chloroflexota bacterium]
MFDYEADKNNSRYSASGEGKTHPNNVQPTQESLNPVTRQNQPAESIPNRTLPLPPSGASVPAPVPTRTGSPRRRTKSAVQARDWAWVVIAGAVIAVIAVIGITLTVLMSGGTTQFDQPMVTSAAILPTPVDARNRYQPSLLNVGETITLDDGSELVLRAWNGTERFNILLMGIDRRPGESGMGYRSDTMMLVSLNPKTHQVGILSIPRDLYVPVPGYNQPQRINTALALGELQREGYGPTLAMQTVQYNLGMGVNAYMVADFTALIKVIDAIGGIDVDVPAPIADYQFPDMNFGFDPLVLSAGFQHMDGYTAQKYARTRHGDSDFDRARRQQQVVFAMRDQILSLESLPQLIIQAPSLYGSISQNVYTELSLDQMIQLGLWLKDLQPDSIHTGVIDQLYVSDLTTSDGAAVLSLNTAAVPTLLTQVFGADYAQP